MIKVNVYRSGMVACSACAPKDMPIAEIESEVNAVSPTGISSRWKVSSDPKFRTGQSNPCVCNNDPARLHYLMNC